MKSKLVKSHIFNISIAYLAIFSGCKNANNPIIPDDLLTRKLEQLKFSCISGHPNEIQGFTYDKYGDKSLYREVQNRIIDASNSNKNFIYIAEVGTGDYLEDVCYIEGINDYNGYGQSVNINKFNGAPRFSFTTSTSVKKISWKEINSIKLIIDGINDEKFIDYAPLMHHGDHHKIQPTLIIFIYKISDKCVIKVIHSPFFYIPAYRAINERNYSHVDFFKMNVSNWSDVVSVMKEHYHSIASIGVIDPDNPFYIRQCQARANLVKLENPTIEKDNGQDQK